VKPSLAVIVFIFATSSARADIGPFLPGTHYAQPRHLIETNESHPDYVFVLTQLKFELQRTVSDYVDLAPGKSVTLTPGYREDATLWIVPKAAAAAYATAQELTEAARTGAIPGVVKRDFAFRETVPAWNARKITMTYRVQRNQSGTGLEIVQTSWDPMISWYAAAICVSVAFVLGGFWLIRRFCRIGRTRVSNPAM
jgi:hypothetical protein